MKDWSNEFGHGAMNARLDVDALVDECGLDEREIAWRKEFVGFDETDERHLSNLESTFRDHTEEIADEFYENLTGHDQTTAIFGRSEKGLEQLKRTQSAYLVTLASGEYGMDYFRDRARIGKIHDMLEMPMKHYVGQYGVYYDLVFPLLFDRVEDQLVERLTGEDGAAAGEDGPLASDGGAVAAQADAGPSVRSTVRDELDRGLEEMLAVLRIINLDMQVVADTYIHSYSQELEASIEQREALMREVERDLAQPIEGLHESATDVADSADEITALAASQAESMADVGSEVGNMSATVEEIAATADEVAATSERAEELASDGRAAATEAIEVMERVTGSSQDVVADVDRLHERIDEIDEIVEVINDIADQTNMLALNASIEAARAGEAGDGFAVVADEVKSLAEESQEHAGEIEGMVDDIKAETTSAVESLEETTDEVDRGMAQVESAMETLQDIADAVAEASQGIREVSDATDDQAASTEEVASMADELVAQADRVADEIESVAAANEEQTVKVSEIRETVDRLTE